MVEDCVIEKELLEKQASNIGENTGVKDKQSLTPKRLSEYCGYHELHGENYRG